MPNTVIRPAAGFSSVVSIRMVVVLPAPFGPSSPNVSPGRMTGSRDRPPVVLTEPVRHVLDD